MKDSQEEDSLKEWILREMVSSKEEDQSLVRKALSEFRGDARKVMTIREDGRITVADPKLSAKPMVLSYVIGAAYAAAGGLRQEDAVANKELIDELNLKEGTVRPTTKELRDENLIVQKVQGVHRVNYKKLRESLDLILKGSTG